jgi:hypothetical protein
MFKRLMVEPVSRFYFSMGGGEDIAYGRFRAY